MPSLLEFDELHTQSYELLDKAEESLLRYTVQRFNDLKCRVRRLTPKQVIKECKTLYDDLWKTTQKTYLKMCQRINDDCDFDWMWLYLTDYDPVWKTIYNNEVDRKQARTAEGIIASEDKDKQKRLETAQREWVRMIDQVGIGAVDKAVIERMKDNGVEYVQWVTEHDERVCSECNEYDGKVYPIDKIPEKHIGCRCHLIAYK